MNYASICSGVESASLAWKSLGWDPVFFSEIDKFASAVLAYHYPNVPNLGDMKQIDGKKYEGNINLIVGGTPCQGFSIAGTREGLKDERSGLAQHFIRLLSEIKPKWFIWENVPGVLSTNRGRDFARIIQAFTNTGYSLAWRVLDAQWVRTNDFPNAVPQRRRRLFVVGYFGTDSRHPAEVLFEQDMLFGNPTPCRIKTKSTSANSASNLRINCFRESCFSEFIETDFSATLKACGGINGGGTESIITNYSTHSDWFYNAGIKSTMPHMIKFSPTLISNSNQPMCVSIVENEIKTKYNARRLTPKECERLMGFYDDYTLIPSVNKLGIAPTLRYKACGNSMCVNVMQWLGERIQKVEKSNKQ